MKKIYPLPEAIDGHPWSVEAGRGSCNTVARELYVPLSDSDHDRFVRAHELGHAAITPRVPAWKQCKKFGVSMQALQSCEDLRVHHLLHKAHVGPLRGLEYHEANSLVRSNLNNERVLGAALVSSMNTDDGALLINILSGLVPEEVLTQLRVKVRLIQQRLLMGKGADRWIGLRNCTIPAARLFDALFPPNGEAPAEYGDIPLQSLAGRRGRGHWGEMTVQNLPKSLTRAVVPLSQRRVFRDEGARLAAPYRLPVDGRVFCQKKRSVGGTVLIDGSGSMSLSSAELRKIIAAAPATLIGIYSGSGKKGTLTIIGAKGRVVDDAGLALARSSGQGNIVDGPALEWLADHEGPRVWVSDGLVTGRNDDASIDLAVEAQRICTQNGIRRVTKADAVVDLLNAVTLRWRFPGSSWRRIMDARPC